MWTHRGGMAGYVLIAVWMMQQEILFPPLSYLEVVGEVSYTTTKLGAVWKEACFRNSYSNNSSLSNARWYYVVTHHVLYRARS